MTHAEVMLVLVSTNITSAWVILMICMVPIFSLSSSVLALLPFAL